MKLGTKKCAKLIMKTEKGETTKMQLHNQESMRTVKRKLQISGKY